MAEMPVRAARDSHAKVWVGECADDSCPGMHRCCWAVWDRSRWQSIPGEGRGTVAGQDGVGDPGGYDTLECVRRSEPGVYTLEVDGWVAQ